MGPYSILIRSLMLVVGATLIGACFALSRWPVAQLYAITAVGVISMATIARNAVRDFPSADERRGLNFSVRTLLVWVVPIVAAVSWIAGWQGPFDDAFLNANAKVGMLLVLTQAWVCAYIIIRARRSQRESLPPIETEKLDRN